MAKAATRKSTKSAASAKSAARAKSAASPRVAGSAPIDIDDLFRKLADPTLEESDLRPYFSVDEAGSEPFKPRIEINEATVRVPPTPEGRARGAMAIGSLNSWCRMRRLVRFNNIIGDGYKGPIIVSEGDSWFQYPVLIDDTIDHLYDRGYAIRSLDAAGDTLENMLASGEYLDALRQTGASVLLLSAGGNDILGGGEIGNFLRPFDEDLLPPAYILPSFQTQLDTIIGQYDQMIRSAEGLPGDVAMFVHGYDWPLPNGGKWLGRPMARLGIEAPALQAAIAGEMINRFNTRLAKLAKGFAGVTYLDLRGVVGTKLSDWADELHPTSATFDLVAQRFDAAIKAASPRSFANLPRPSARPSLAVRSRRGKASPLPAPPASSGRRGISLHVGLNKIDAQHYGDDGALAACIFDAKAMRGIATDAGFGQIDLLENGQGTREQIKDRIERAAAILKAGDLFVFTYAGHGSQLPDINLDETDDALDEVWCLYDGMFLDDEAAALWSKFNEGVRVLVILDSCHSGTAIRAQPSFLSAGLRDKDGLRARYLPTSVVAAAYHANDSFYRKIGGKKGGDSALALENAATAKNRSPIKCSVRLLSGCQDNQVSMDGFFNGRFTEEFLKVWDGGRFRGSYNKFHRAMLNGMPPSQTPNHLTIGVADAAFNAQRPFTI